MRDAASKSAENAARLAALFQAFEHGIGGTVGVDAFEGASRIAAWYLNDSRRFFGEQALPKKMALAVRLDAWLVAHCEGAEPPRVNKRYAQQYGPLRDGGELGQAIDELDELDRARLVKEGKQQVIYLNPALLRGGAQ